jgi:hypothetical protein
LTFGYFHSFKFFRVKKRANAYSETQWFNHQQQWAQYMIHHPSLERGRQWFQQQQQQQ